MVALPKALRGPRVSATHQQFPRRPCRMSEGRGVRKTDHLTPRSLKLLQLISWGRSHFLMRCWTLSASGNPTERGPGGKLSSTKFTEFWGKAEKLEEGEVRIRHKHFDFRQRHWRTDLQIVMWRGEINNSVIQTTQKHIFRWFLILDFSEVELHHK